MARVAIRVREGIPASEEPGDEAAADWRIGTVVEGVERLRAGK